MVGSDYCDSIHKFYVPFKNISLIQTGTRGDPG